MSWIKTRIQPLLQEQYLVPLKIAAVYLVWKLFDRCAKVPGTPLHLFRDQMIYRLGSWYATATSFILSSFGMFVNAHGININLIESNKQVWVQYHCLAIPAMVVFAGSVLFFRGKLKDKLLFIAIGLAGIVILNIIRLVLLSLAWVYFAPWFFDINHSLIYVVIMYGFIFFMVIKWMDRVTLQETEKAPDC